MSQGYLSGLLYRLMAISFDLLVSRSFIGSLLAIGLRILIFLKKWLILEFNLDLILELELDLVQFPFLTLTLIPIPILVLVLILIGLK